MTIIDATGHLCGRSAFLDDLPLQAGTLHAAVLGSPVAHARLQEVAIEESLSWPGVKGVLTAADIPGDNQIGGILADEPLLASGGLDYCGQPVALVVAGNVLQAREARRLIRLDYESLPAVTDPLVARATGALLLPPRTFQLGDVDLAWSLCEYVFSGTTQTGSQEHVYLETQGAYALPDGAGGLRLYSATQAPSLVQYTVGRVLGLPMHRIEVITPRLGGAFGGKEDQATAWACLAALAAWRLQRPVKLTLPRGEDMRMTGKRHPYHSRFRIGLSKDLKILAYEVEMVQDGGAAADLSPAILERSLFHATNAYSIPHVRATAMSVRTNLPPNTAFRGFGGPQAIFVMEAAIAHAAAQLGVPAAVIQRHNLLQENDEFPYGQRAKPALAHQCWAMAEKLFEPERRAAAAAAFNRVHSHRKKGLALMPICFGISFTKTSMNQAGALLHIYRDGSIGLSSGAVEMGQGVNTKLVQVAADSLGVHPRRIKVAPTDTSRVANTSPTAASTGADLNGKAVQAACKELRERLLPLAAELLRTLPGDIAIREDAIWRSGQATTLSWEKLIAEAFLRRIDLSAHGYYATPRIYFDLVREKGRPFAYHVYGLAVVEATVDCLRGTYTIDSVEIVHDFGNSLNPGVDLGQVEGGLVQGIGWLTSEEVIYDAEGRLLSDSLSTYKPPDVYASPRHFDCRPLPTKGPVEAILRSKAVGEPPFLYGIGAYFALLAAIRAFNPRYQPDYCAPLTPERVLTALYAGHQIAAI